MAWMLFQLNVSHIDLPGNAGTCIIPITTDRNRPKILRKRRQDILSRCKQEPYYLIKLNMRIHISSP